MPKLTKEMVDNMIREAMLNEDINLAGIPDHLNSTPKANYQAQSSQIKAKVKKLADNDLNPATISADDIKAAYKDSDEAEIAAINFLDQGLAKNKSSGKEFNSIIDKVRSDAVSGSMAVGASKIKAADKPQAIFQFDLANAGMQEGTPTMSPALKNVFDTIGLEDETLYGRIQKINAFTANLEMAAGDKGGKGDDQAAQDLRDMGLIRFTRYVLVLDYINTIVKNMDSGSGAYLFETFLAALAGGNVSGKQKSGTGKMVGADFTFGDNPNARGSAKYLKSTSAASQSPKGFLKREFVHYVVARKILDSSGKGGASSMDVSQIIGLEIYYPVLYVIEPQKRFQFFKVTQNNQVEEDGDAFNQKLDESINIPTDQDNLLGTLSLVTTNTDKYRDLVERAVKTIGGKFKKAFDGFKDAFDAVATAKESVGLYSTSGKQSDGDQAITDMVAYKKALKGVFDELAALRTDEPAQATGYQAPTDTSQLDENKQKKFQDLDKMIEELMLEHLRGNINDNN